MIIQESLNIIAEAEAAGDINASLRHLRQLPLNDFTELLFGSSTIANYPFLQSILPTMPPEEQQKKWNAQAGLKLMPRSVAFIKTLEQAYVQINNSPLQNVPILDFGCGWGRLTRLLIKYVEPHHIWGVDPMDQSLEHCANFGILGTFRQSQLLPDSLPVDEPIKAVFAHSVFTHTSYEATKTCWQAIANACAPNAVFVFTIRPIEFWSLKEWDESPAMIAAHNETGYAFAGFNKNQWLAQGKSAYGNTSMSHQLAKSLLQETGWKWVGYERAFEDEYQTRIIAVKA